MTSVDDFIKPAFGTISVGDISQKGKAKIAPIFDADGKPIKIIFIKEASSKHPMACFFI